MNFEKNIKKLKKLLIIVNDIDFFIERDIIFLFLIKLNLNYMYLIMFYF